MDDGSRKYLTRYLITYRLFKEGSNPLNCVMVDRDVTTYLIEKILSNLTYEVRVHAAVEELLSDVVTIVASTLIYTEISTSPTGMTGSLIL